MRNRFAVLIAATFISAIGITGAMVIAETVAPVADAIPVVDEAPAASAAVDHIYTGGCGWSASGQLVSAQCPYRDNWHPGNAQAFRIRTVCSSAPNGGGAWSIRVGPFREGGNWIASSVSCSGSYPYRVVGGGHTYIEFI